MDEAESLDIEERGRHRVRHLIAPLYREQHSLMAYVSRAIVIVFFALVLSVPFFLNSAQVVLLLISFLPALFASFSALFLSRSLPRLSSGILVCGMHIGFTVFLVEHWEIFPGAYLLVISGFFCLLVLLSGLIGGVWASFLSGLYGASLMASAAFSSHHSSGVASLDVLLSCLFMLVVGLICEGWARMLRRLVLRLPETAPSRVVEILFPSLASSAEKKRESLDSQG